MNNYFISNDLENLIPDDILNYCMNKFLNTADEENEQTFEFNWDPNRCGMEIVQKQIKDDFFINYSNVNLTGEPINKLPFGISIKKEKYGIFITELFMEIDEKWFEKEDDSVHNPILHTVYC